MNLMICGKCKECGYTNMIFDHKCNPFETDTKKKNLFERIFDYLVRIDIMYPISFVSATMINGLIIRHVNLTPFEAAIESFCLGVVLVRILKQ